MNFDLFIKLKKNQSTMSFFDKVVRHLDLDDFDKRDKVAFVSLACVTVIIIVLWIMQLQNNIIFPLYGGTTPEKIKQEALNAQASAAATDADLKNKDTDKDSLSDWDELNIYKTSPYLADSDSDGISDYDEIKKGTDPNCPTGQTCNGTSSLDAATNPTPDAQDALLNNLLNQAVSNSVTPEVSPVVTPNNSGKELTAEEKANFKKLLGDTKDPAVIRNFLLANGANPATINSVSDQDLQKVLDELLK